MKKKSILSSCCFYLIASTLTAPAFADTCPDPVEIKATNTSDGLVVSRSPEKYYYHPAILNTVPEKFTPIEFIGVQVYGVFKSENNKPIIATSSDIRCAYGIAKHESGNYYTAGNFYLDIRDTQANSFILDMSKWRASTRSSGTFVCGAEYIEKPEVIVESESCTFTKVKPTYSSLRTSKTKQIAK